MSINRRQFERLQLSDTAFAIDGNGRQLGPVSQAGGGGMLIVSTSKEIAESLPIGTELQVTVMEPKSQTAHTIDVVVRYCEDEKIGVEFVTGK